MATTPTLEHSQNTFIWRFVIFNPTDSRVVHVEASTEREARNCCPSGCVAVFAARIRQGVRHA
ncbi:host cell division inhibitor Icd-like protein [Escherichia coli]|uniref:Host cell division inhibitor Icd-like protein n=2 Tax=Escherichia TaxID=561 RepID=A0A2X7S910_ECOLX|nr:MULTISPECIES: host cell division inhibitor Icd-like protein [Enterobacteriaceae]EAB5852721.1 host cell division inhibitor Icd-like protein [Salmonella enterica subsp. enterica serovar Infantis]EEH6507212.1 host cell division inhibitor Icd-like protein [Salmonella enterica subsp. enterica serovar Braenderup]EEZ6685891.1 host cell division inhibitor Icd-like protein [Escherichia coli O25]EEZ9743068.1 host cell division inhibitor Icd-like protein [Escherichia coli O157]EFN8439049.1 host cell d